MAKRDFTRIAERFELAGGDFYYVPENEAVAGVAMTAQEVALRYAPARAHPVGVLLAVRFEFDMGHSPLGCRFFRRIVAALA